MQDWRSSMADGSGGATGDSGIIRTRLWRHPVAAVGCGAMMLSITLPWLSTGMFAGLPAHRVVELAMELHLKSAALPPWLVAAAIYAPPIAGAIAWAALLLGAARGPGSSMALATLGAVGLVAAAIWFASAGHGELDHVATGLVVAALGSCVLLVAALAPAARPATGASPASALSTTAHRTTVS